MDQLDMLIEDFVSGKISDLEFENTLFRFYGRGDVLWYDTVELAQAERKQREGEKLLGVDDDGQFGVGA